MTSWVVKITANLLMDWSKGGTFALYTLVSSFTTVFVYFWVPETKGKALEAIQKARSVGRSIDVSSFNNYYELCLEIERMFGLEGLLNDSKGSDWKLIFVDFENDVLLVGDDPWEEFVGCVRCIRILSPSEVQQMGKKCIKKLAARVSRLHIIDFGIVLCFNFFHFRCEPFSTYPRTYGLIHVVDIGSLTKGHDSGKTRCNLVNLQNRLLGCSKLGIGQCPGGILALLLQIRTCPFNIHLLRFFQKHITAFQHGKWYPRNMNI